MGVRMESPARLARSGNEHHPRTDGSSGDVSMNIQKMGGDDAHALAYTGQAQQAQVMALPDVAAPRSNPLLMIWRRKGVLLAVMAGCAFAAIGLDSVSPPIL